MGAWAKARRGHDNVFGVGLTGFVFYEVCLQEGGGKEDIFGRSLCCFEIGSIYVSLRGTPCGLVGLKPREDGVQRC